MIHAYAIEPSVVVGWSDPSQFRFVWDKFGIGTPRVLLELPIAEWENAVMSVAAGDGLSDLRWKRLDELLLVLREGKVRRAVLPYTEENAWLENAETEYARHPFAAIIALANPRDHTAVIKESDLGRPRDARWNVTTAATPSRDPSALADAVRAMLANCNEIHFVDPHFGPENARHRKVMEAMLAAVSESRPEAPRRMVLHCSAKVELSYFESRATAMAQRLPMGLTLQFRRWAQRDGGERFHNRYILTDIGGVTFGIGLDDGPVEQSDDINLMSKEQYRKRWAQFVGSNASFDLDGPQPRAVQGQARVGKDGGTM